MEMPEKLWEQIYEEDRVSLSGGVHLCACGHRAFVHFRDGPGHACYWGDCLCSKFQLSLRVEALHCLLREGET